MFRNLVIAQVDSYVNVRSTSSEEGEILGKLYDNSVGTFISEENGWYQPFSSARLTPPPGRMEEACAVMPIPVKAIVAVKRYTAVLFVVDKIKKE